MISEIKRIIKDSEIMKEDDSKWPQKNKDGRQELEIRLGNEQISFEVRTEKFKPPASTADDCIDCQNRVAGRRDRVGRSRRAPRFLLSCARSQGTCLLAYILTFQGEPSIDLLSTRTDHSFPDQAHLSHTFVTANNSGL